MATNALEIPLEDQPIKAALPKKARDKVSLWLKEINALLAVERGIDAAFRASAIRLNVSYSAVKTVYYKITKEIALYDAGLSELHPWRVLIDGRHCSNDSSKVPSEFIEYWHGLILDHKRNVSDAYKTLCRHWRAGDVIPGFPASDRPPTMPDGLSYRNLKRPKYMPSRAIVALGKLGIAGAKPFLPCCLQDVSQVRPLEYILFDDVELDFLVVVPGLLTPVKLRLIVAMDLCTRVILGYGVRPAIPREDGAEDGLKLRDMKAVCARLLATWGLPVGFIMNWIVERGTATLPIETQEALREISGGRIVVHETSMIVGQVFEFKDKATGNSWGKAWLESFFNRLHGELSLVEGQKGRRYDLAPAELEGRKKELAQLVRAGKRLPIELRYQFKWPFPTVQAALQELDAALFRLHTEPGRELQGFDQAILWRLNENDGWKSEEQLAEYPELAGKVQYTTRQETCMERWNRLTPSVQRTPVPDSSLARFMDEHRVVRFQDYQFSFTYEKADYTYLPSDALLPLLEHNTQYVLWFHPQDMSVVYITRPAPHLGYVGTLTRFTRARRGDLEAAKVNLKEKARIFGHALAGTQQTKIDRINQRAADLENHAEILRNAQALETEVDVAPDPAGHTAPAIAAPASVQAMTGDINSRADTARRDKRLSTQAERALAAISVPEPQQQQTINPEELAHAFFNE